MPREDRHKFRMLAEHEDMVEDLLVRIGDKLMELRLAAGWRRAEVADHSGIPLPTLRAIERGLIFPQWSELVRLSRVLGIHLGDLNGLQLEVQPPVPKYGNPEKDR